MEQGVNMFTDYKVYSAVFQIIQSGGEEVDDQLVKMSQVQIP